MKNIRLERLNDAFQEELSLLLLREVKDEAISFVTIREVEITSDYSYAKVYYTCLNESKKEETEKALERAKGFLRRELSHKFNIYKTPELRFIYDQSDEYGKHIDELIEKVNEQK